MNTVFFERLKERDQKIEFLSITLSLIGLALYLLENEYSKYLLISGSLILIVLYALRFYTPNRLENIFSAMEIFIDKIVHGSLAISIAGILATLLEKDGMTLLITGIGSATLSLLFMIYNKIKLESEYIWGKKYFLRIFCIIGLGLFILLSQKGLINYNL